MGKIKRYCVHGLKVVIFKTNYGIEVGKMLISCPQNLHILSVQHVVRSAVISLFQPILIAELIWLALTFSQ